jgi:tRNA(Ile)-lysidine synthase
LNNLFINDVSDKKMTGKRVKQLTLDQRVLDYIQSRGLIADGQTLLVAVSGGQDSVCLLHILNNLQSVLNIRLHVAHLDHQLRGKESAADAKYVAALAKKLDIPATIAKRDVQAYRKAHHISLEEAAREVRYAFLAETAASIGASAAAVGHTSDDQAETILLHLVRGTGTKGLRGLQPVSQLKLNKQQLTVLRPLLEVSHAETGAYCESFNLRPRQDASNLLLEPLRNRVRLELLPLLKGYNPRIVDSLRRTAQLSGDDIDCLENEADCFWQQIAVYQDNRVVLEKHIVEHLGISLQRILLRKAVETVTGTLKDIEARHIEEMVRAVAGPVGRSIDLSYGLVFSSDYMHYYLGKAGGKKSEFTGLSGECRIKISGLTTIPGWKIRTGFVKGYKPNTEDGFTADFDYAKTGNELVVRARQSADRFQPLGMRGTKKVGEYMLDAKIPQAARNSIPIIAAPDGIVWVAGFRIDERFKVTAETKKVLRIKLEKI